MEAACPRPERNMLHFHAIHDLEILGCQHVAATKAINRIGSPPRKSPDIPRAIHARLPAAI